MQAYGRKYVSIGLNFLSAIGFLIFAMANNVPCLFAARIVQGMSTCSVLILGIILGEYSHPKRRGYFMSMKKSSVGVGAVLCHSIALKWNWKKVAAVAAIPNTVAIFLTFLWPESPSFLAYTGKYAECEKSHRWLFGDGPNSNRELEDLISTQMENKKHETKSNDFKDLIRSMLRKDFLKPFIISVLVTIITDACGRYFMLAYVVQILIEVTKDESVTSFCTIGSDLLTVVALLASCFVIRSWKRRTLLFTFGITCVCLMCLTSVLTFLKSYYDIGGSVYWWLTPLVILSNVFVINMGVVPICFTIMGEIFPLEHKGTGTFTSGIVFTVFYAIVMKCTPIMMEKTGVQGTFGIYALIVAFGLTLLYFTLNETKDKTLQQIEREIKGVKQTQVEEYCLKKELLVIEP